MAPGGDGSEGAKRYFIGVARGLYEAAVPSCVAAWHPAELKASAVFGEPAQAGPHFLRITRTAATACIRAPALPPSRPRTPRSLQSSKDPRSRLPAPCRRRPPQALVDRLSQWPVPPAPPAYVGSFSGATATVRRRRDPAISVGASAFGRRQHFSALALQNFGPSYFLRH